MALLIINNLQFTLNNENILSENKTIKSITVEGGKPYLAKATETITVNMSFTDNDPFFLNQFALLKAKLELAMNLSWTNPMTDSILTLCTYIGKDEVMPWGKCTGLSFDAHAQNNRKIFTVSFTTSNLSQAFGLESHTVSITNGFISLLV